MKWKKYFSEKPYIHIIFLLLLPAFSAKGESKYEERIIKYQDTWNKLIPKYTKVQFAGGMGFLSFGTGWDYGKNKQWETDILLGFIPEFEDDKYRITLSIKQNFIPWNIDLGKNFSLDPFTGSVYFNTILDRDYWINSPDKYPNNYYSFSTKIRFNFSIGQRVTYTLKEDKRKLIKDATFYYEFGTNELYIYSAFNNSYLKPKDYLSLSLGIKMQIL